VKFNRLFFILIILTALALGLRVFNLQIRPMHTDEAVHAIKFGKLLEEGFYRYDKNEYHGPSLNYMTLLPAWLMSQNELNETNEYTLRIVPVFIGIGLILLLLIIKSYINKTTLFLTAVLITISPIMVFYSRYYIQEILLVFFTYGFIFTMIRLWYSKRIIWALLTGICLGMMHATKETWIISFGVLFFTTIILIFTNNVIRNEIGSRLKGNIRNLSVLIFTAIVISALFYSSFFKNPQGVIDSIAAFSNYFNKAGNFDRHIHPWYFYLGILGYKQNPDFLWSEIFLLIAGLLGLLFLFKKKTGNSNQILRLIGIYSLTLGIIYSLLPYKTPWNILGFYYGWLILAGYGFSEIFKIKLSKSRKIALYIFLSVGMIHLIYQTYLSNFKYFADPSNPYVYGHTSKDIFNLVDMTDQIIQVHPEGKNMMIEVICENHDYWPLPWYFRDYYQVGWWDEVNMDIAAAPIIIASPVLEAHILQKLYEKPPPGQRYLYVPMFRKPVALRPNVYLEGYVRKDVWDVYVQKSSIE